MKNWMCAGALLPMVGWAQLTVSPEVTDFGKVVQGERPSAVVTLVNPTSKPIVIRDVIRTCSCADLVLEKRTLAPGESTKATFVLDSNVFDGPFQKTFFLRTEGGPSATATVKGDIRPRWKVEPGTTIALKENESTATFKVIPLDGEGAEPMIATFTPPKTLSAGYHQWKVAVWPDVTAAQPVYLTVTKRVGTPWVTVPRSLFINETETDFSLVVYLKPDTFVGAMDPKVKTIDPSTITVEPLRDGMTLTPAGPATTQGIPLRLSIPKEHLGSWKTPKTFVFTIPGHGTASLYLKSKIME